ncbi:MAG TPA: transcriptional repressor [Candidatus Bathyarchaeia archaeon]|nr:transcriptional repressor [Candidatus Bathyarchaeia archaeon]
MPKKIAQMGPGPLERLFGSSMARLLDFFTLHENYEYSKTEVAECAEVSIRTVLRALPYLEEHGIVKHTRTVGNAEMYQTNTESPIIQHLHKAAQAIADIDVVQELESQGYKKEKQTIEKTETIKA